MWRHSMIYVQRPQPTPAPVRVCFVIAVWLFIAVNAWEAWQVMTLSPASDPLRGTAFEARIKLRPFAVMALMLIFWFRFFQGEREGARVFAAMVAVVGLVYTLIFVLTSDLYNTPLDGRVWIYLYVALAHGWYAVAGRERGP